MGCHTRDGVAGMGCRGRSLAGRVTPQSGGPGVGRDLPGSVGCQQPPSCSPFSPRRCGPRGRVPALPGEWAPGPPGQPHSPVPQLPRNRGVIGAHPRRPLPHPSLAPVLIGSRHGTDTRRRRCRDGDAKPSQGVGLGRGANRLVTITGTPPQGPQRRVPMAGSPLQCPHPRGRGWVLALHPLCETPITAPASPRVTRLPWGHGDLRHGRGTPGRCPQHCSLPQRASGEGCLLKPKRTNPCAYTPPSLKGTG